jgi:hypothetical protein
MKKIEIQVKGATSNQVVIKIHEGFLKNEEVYINPVTLYHVLKNVTISIPLDNLRDAAATAEKVDGPTVAKKLSNLTNAL